MIVPYALDGAQESVAFDSTLDSLGTTSQRTSPCRTASARKGRHDTFLG